MSLKITTFLKQIKLKKSNVYKWVEKGNIKKKTIKGGEDFHIFIKTEFILKKTKQMGTGVVSKVIAHLQETVRDAIRV